MKRPTETETTACLVAAAIGIIGFMLASRHDVLVSSSLMNHRLRDLFEGGVAKFNTYTFMLGPALVGYLAARWTPIYARLIPAVILVLAGTWWVRFSDHWFGFAYAMPNAMYAVACCCGLLRRTRCKEETFWGQHHLDWMLVSGATATMMVFYVRPSA